MNTTITNARIKYRWLRKCIRVIIVLFILLNIMAAFHAYKLTHNYTISSQAHKKPERMSFAEKMSALFFGVKNTKSQISSYPGGSYLPVYFFTTNKLKIEGWLMKRDSSMGTVILFHGHMGNKGAMLPEANRFLAAGYNTLLIDFRAHGNSEGVACTIGEKEAEEVKLAYNFIKASGEKNIILWGTSMGAAAICSSIDKYEIDPQAIILEMPFASLRNAVEGRVKVMGIPQEPVSTLLTFWGGVEQGFWAFNYQPSEYVKKIKCPVLLQWGELDKRVSRKETETIYRNIKAVKKLETYPEAGHESLFKNDSLHWINAVTSFLEMS